MMMMMMNKKKKKIYALDINVSRLVFQIAPGYNSWRAMYAGNSVSGFSRRQGLLMSNVTLCRICVAQ